jgi:hypothetical protein
LWITFLSVKSPNSSRAVTGSLTKSIKSQPKPKKNAKCHFNGFACEFTVKIIEHTVASYKTNDFTWTFLTEWAFLHESAESVWKSLKLGNLVYHLISYKNRFGQEFLLLVLCIMNFWKILVLSKNKQIRWITKFTINNNDSHVYALFLKVI